MGGEHFYKQGLPAAGEYVNVLLQQSLGLQSLLSTTEIKLWPMLMLGEGGMGEKNTRGWGPQCWAETQHYNIQPKAVFFPIADNL